MFNRKSRLSDNLSSASQLKKPPNKVGMLIDLEKVRQYNLIDNPMPIQRLKLKQEHKERYEGRTEVAIQTD